MWKPEKENGAKKKKSRQTGRNRGHSSWALTILIAEAVGSPNTAVAVGTVNRVHETVALGLGSVLARVGGIAE